MNVTERISPFYTVEGLPDDIEKGALFRALFENRHVLIENGNVYAVLPSDYYDGGKPRRVTLATLNGEKMKDRALAPDAVLVSALPGLTVTEYLKKENDVLNVAENALYMALFKAGLAPIVVSDPAYVESVDGAVKKSKRGIIPVIERGAASSDLMEWVTAPTGDVTAFFEAYRGASEAFARKSGSEIFLPERDRMTRDEVQTINDDFHTLPRIIIENVNAGFAASGVDWKLGHIAEEPEDAEPEETEETEETPEETAESEDK